VRAPQKTETPAKEGQRATNITTPNLKKEWPLGDTTEERMQTHQRGSERVTVNNPEKGLIREKKKGGRINRGYRKRLSEGRGRSKHKPEDS